MSVKFRAGSAEDAALCGEICYRAFTRIAGEHNFPPDIPNRDFAEHLLKMFWSLPGIYSVVAEEDGRVVGSNFLWEQSSIAGVGPITVDPEVQNRSVGRGLMDKVLERVREKRFAGVRLVQAGYHCRSLSLYTKLGFEVREPLVTLQGSPIRQELTGYLVRPAVQSDLQACNALCRQVHGHEREFEISGAIERGVANIVERNGALTGYATGIGFFTHAVAKSSDDLKALIAAAEEFGGPGFLLPMRNTEVFRWCLQHGLRVTQPMNLMSMGLYNEPKGAFLPSILF
jgi:GNAT superfamily N-acetyltransferase